ncbi:MAG: hypothetical protein HZY76_11820 [Anaerolineae bacterium]|nr:MAG: hypothetical protein HZY76_11820 [Anaerolineae bacterium]
MTVAPTPTQTLDNRGSNCAAGFVQLLEMMESLAPGETLAILSTDAASQRELRGPRVRAIPCCTPRAAAPSGVVSTTIWFAKSRWPRPRRSR